MAPSATGPTTPNFGLPTLSTGADAPDGIGINNIVTAIDTAMLTLIPKSLGTTAGDLIYFSGASTPVRLAAAANTNVLTLAGGLPTWAAGPSGLLTRDYTEVFRSAALSINNLTGTKVGFDAETFDDNNKHDNVTNNTRITFSSAGLYLVGAHVGWAANGSGGRYAYIIKNNTTVIIANDVPAGGETFSLGDNAFSVAHVMAANDFIELTVNQSSGGALALNVGVDSGVNAATKLWALRLA